MTSLPPRDLSAALGRPDRAAGLRLPAKKVSAPTRTPRQGQQRPEQAESAPAAHGTVPAPRLVPTSATEQRRAILVLWTPESIRARMKALRAAEGTLFIDIVLDAIEATVDELPALVASKAQSQTVHGRLFDRIRATVSAEQSETKVQITIRGALASHLAVIDDLVASTGAPNRSALITVALDKALPERPPR